MEVHANPRVQSNVRNMKDWTPPQDREGRPLITFEIDLCRIDQSKCRRRIRQTGERASFCRFALVPSPSNPYGEWVVKQVAPKGQRYRHGGKPDILGTAQVPPGGEYKKRPTPKTAGNEAFHAAARAMKELARQRRKNK